MSSRLQPVTPRVCEQCGNTIPRGKGEPPSKYVRRRYCGKACVALTFRPSEARRRTPNPDVIEDVKWLLESRESPDRIAARVGRGYANAASLARTLEAWGCRDLARSLTRMEGAA